MPPSQKKVVLRAVGGSLLWSERAFCSFFECSAMTNEPILLPVAPYSVESHFLSLDRYRGIVEGVVFDRLGRSSFFDESVEIVQRRVAQTSEIHRQPVPRKSSAMR